MADTIFGISTGAYSDWHIIGYMETREEAEKYCALQNKNEKLKPDDWNAYGITEISKIEASVEKVNIKYYHEVVFDFEGDFGKYKMRDEPTRYDFYAGREKPKKFLVQTRGPRLAGICVTAKNRKAAEKIACDLMAQLAYAYTELGDIKKAMEQVGAQERRV